MPSKTTTATTRKTYTPEFVAKALAGWEKARTSGMSGEEAAKSVGAPISMLYYWKSRKEGKSLGRKKAKSTGHALVRTTGPGSLVEPPHYSVDVAALRREIAQLKEECEVLKKTVVVFARGR